MSKLEYVLLGMVVGLFLLGWLAGKFIAHLKRTNHNTEVWGTIFEGVTNKLIDLDPVKKPEVFIEKKARQGGRALGKNDTKIGKGDADNDES